MEGAETIDKTDENEHNTGGNGLQRKLATAISAASHVGKRKNGASCQHGTLAVASACQCSFVAGEISLGSIINIRTHIGFTGRRC